MGRQTLGSIRPLEERLPRVIVLQYGIPCSKPLPKTSFTKGGGRAVALPPLKQVLRRYLLINMASPMIVPIGDSTIPCTCLATPRTNVRWKSQMWGSS